MAADMDPCYGPAACPVCGERQNRRAGGFDPDRDPFGPVVCMVCGHRFTREEFLAGLERPPPAPGARA